MGFTWGHGLIFVVLLVLWLLLGDVERCCLDEHGETCCKPCGKDVREELSHHEDADELFVRVVVGQEPQAEADDYNCQGEDEAEACEDGQHSGCC